MADELIVATGRKPHTDDLGVETIGLEPGAYVEVDDRMRATGVDGDWLYARRRRERPRAADAHGQVPGARGRGRDPGRRRDGRPGRHDLAARDFTDPQVAAVGHTLDSAREAGLNVRVVDREISMNAGASFYGRNTPGRPGWSWTRTARSSWA